ncbi:DUF6152 family protein [Candidatus Palauibacter sp.]|uniref:DUF6152 family protein n=1 Tax=Candidatus Palauibacter sp. TaxID=3101350 RepID=UPI003C705F0F
MRKISLYLLAGGVALAAAAPLIAHHAFGAEFDRDAPIRLQGSVVMLEWVNPHTWIHLEVQTDTATHVWMVEGGTPNTLLRRGLKRDCLAPGTELIVDGYQAKDHSLKRANGRDVTFTDGTKFFMGSSGAGAPPGGAPRPNEPSYQNNPCQPPPGWEGEILDVTSHSILEEHD